jgi:YhcH/YjgK/YiaL family protein
MIVDVLANWRAYADLIPGLSAAFRFLEETDLGKLEMGEYEIEGRSIFALSMPGPSAPIADAPFETHARHLDVHCLASGEEIIGWAPLAGLRVRTEYDPAKDLTFYDPPAEWTHVEMRPGRFAIFLPDDPHLPGRHRDTPREMHKIVVKIRVSRPE